MSLTTTDVAKYVGGQMEVQNRKQIYMYCGQIAEINIAENKGGGELHVTFDWLAKAINYPLPLKRWVRVDPKEYVITLRIYIATQIADGSLALNSRITGEDTILLQANKKKLRLSEVEGLSPDRI